MNDKLDKIRELKNLIHQLTFDRKLIRDKKDRINALKDELPKGVGAYLTWQRRGPGEMGMHIEWYICDPRSGHWSWGA